jgi:hypothetical protein
MASAPVFQIVDEKTRSACAGILEGKGRESSPDAEDDQ